MSSMQLTTNPISPSSSMSVPSPMASQSGGSSDVVYAHNYMSLFPGQVAPSGQVPSVAQPLSHDPLVQCLPGQDMASAAPMVTSPLNNTSVLDETVAASVITHTASSTVTPSDSATTFSHSSDYSTLSAQAPGHPSHLQTVAPLAATSVQQTQTFALPRPLQPPSANKSRPMPRIAPANTLPSSQIILTGLWFLKSRSVFYICKIEM